MRAALSLTIIAALTALSFDAMAATAQPWWEAEVVAGAYQPLAISKDQDTAVLWRPTVAPAPYKRAWVRHESRVASGGDEISVVVLFEYDCATRRDRKLQVTGYTGRNATGRSTSQPISEDWEFPLPDTLGDMVMNKVCAAPD